MDEQTNIKGANQLWKESNTSLPFKDWLEREKEKGTFVLNKKVEDSLATWRANLGITPKDAPVEEKEDNTFIGLNKTVVYVSLLIICLGVGYKIYKNRK